jgi:hypothetical protein
MLHGPIVKNELRTNDQLLRQDEGYYPQSQFDNLYQFQTQKEGIAEEDSLDWHMIQ